MNEEFLKTLWMLRFEKIKRTEEDAAWFYQEVLNECRIAFGDDDKSVALLTELVNEERMHAKLADELVEICRLNHTECGLL